MTFLLGLTAYGCALIHAHRGRGYLLFIAGSVGGAFIRPKVAGPGRFHHRHVLRAGDSSRPVSRPRRTMAPLSSGP